MTGVRKTGDWALARRLLVEGPAKLKVAIGTALRQEAEVLRKEIVTGITSQAPGGEAFKPLSSLTLAARQLAKFRGTKALLVRGDLRNAVSVIVRRDEAFWGVPRKARGKDGRAVVDVAEVQEFGSDPIVIPITPRMRRFLFALYRKAGKSRQTGSRKAVVVVSIPARPFLRPAFKKFSIGVDRRFLGRVSKFMGWGR